MPHLFLLQVYTERYILIGVSYSSKPVGFQGISMSFFNFMSQKYTPVNFQDQRLVEAAVIKEKVVFKMSSKAHQFAFKKIP